MNDLIFLGNTLNTIQGWDVDIKQRVGYQLYRVQNGLNPSDYKPMQAIGTGVQEIRIHIRGQWRVVYTANFDKTVYVLAAFQKKTQKTPLQEIKKAKQLLKIIK